MSTLEPSARPEDRPFMASIPAATKSAAPAAAPATRVAVKHHLLVRLTHWINVPLLLGLIASGLSIYWASPVFLHRPDPVTGSNDYLRDVSAFIGRLLHSPSGGNWVYDTFGLGTRSLAVALRLHWALAYFFMLNG